MKAKIKSKPARIDPMVQARERAVRDVTAELGRVISAVDSMKKHGSVRALDAVALALRACYQMMDSHREA